jgi:regulator of sigma E protease
LPGDLIVQLDGLKNPLWEDTRAKIAINAGQTLPVVLKRGDSVVRTTITPDTYGPSHIGEAGVDPAEQITVAAIEENMPAYKAGVRKGDDIVAINGTGLHFIDGLTHYLQTNKDKPVELTAVRNGQPMQFTMTPVQTDTPTGDKVYRIGFTSMAHEHVDKLPFREALSRSIEQNKKYSLLLIELVQKMVQRKVSVKMMSGPIDIAKVSGEAAREPGWTPLLLLMAGISLNLGIFNLFPIPILDGGVILLLLIEGFIRRDISIQIKERIYQAAFVFLVLFAAMVIFNDLTKIPAISKLLP